MKTYGLIGKKLTHSFSKEIHKKLADYSYKLIELSEEEVKVFFEKKEFCAVNVTIPYKETVMEYLDQVSEIAQRIGAVNTVVNRDGTLYGYNTDYYGMKALAQKIGLDFSGKKVLILGTGGTCKTARVVASDLGADHIVMISRTKKDNCITYQEAMQNHCDAAIIINTTPSGMYPNCGETPIDISCFTKLEGVLDVVYNPLCTNLILDARRQGIKAEGGLYMLVMQAVAAVEKFLDTKIEKETANRVFAEVLSSKENIVLTGMPGSGKSTVGSCMALDGFTFLDTDIEVEKRCGCTIKELIDNKGETYFRDLESQVILEIASHGGQIISTGGGAVLRDENVSALRANGKLYFIDRPLEQLVSTDDRPTANSFENMKKRYEERYSRYCRVCDVHIHSQGVAQKVAKEIAKDFTV